VLALGQAKGFNQVMKHVLFAALAFAALTACASPAAETAETAQPSALAHDLNCNASEQRAPNGEVSTLYIALSVPKRGGVGEFCIATGCEAATFDLAQTRSLSWTGTMRTRDRTDYNANLEISRDLSTFTLSEGSSDGRSVWTGTCNAAGS
jgi:hypothetical protein